MLSAAAAVSLGLGLAAIRVLPTMVVAAESTRSHGMSLAAAADGSPGMVGLLAGYLLPLARLSGLSLHPFYPPSYVGPVVLVLAGVAVLRFRHDPSIILLTALLSLNLLVSLGDSGPIFGLLHRVPIISSFRGPHRFSTASAFFLSILAAYSLENGLWVNSLRKNVAARLKRVALGSSLIVALILTLGAVWVSGSALGMSMAEFADVHRLGSVNPLRPRIGLALVAIPLAFWIVYARYTERVTRTTFGLLSIGITSVLLLGVGMSVTTRQPGLDRPPATAVFLSQDRSLFRVMSYKPSLAMNLILTLLAGGDPNKVDEEGPTQLNFRYRYMAEVLSPNFATQYGLQSVDGYEVLQSTRQAIALSYMGSSSAETYGLIDADGSPEGKELQGKLADIQVRNLLDHLPVL